MRVITKPAAIDIIAIGSKVCGYTNYDSRRLYDHAANLMTILP